MTNLILFCVGVSTGVLIAACFYSRRRGDRETIYYGKGWRQEAEQIERMVRKAERKGHPENN